MKASVCLAAIVPALVAQAARIVQSNDDGWAELYLRSFNDALIEAGHDVVLSAPADNQSGTGRFYSHCVSHCIYVYLSCAYFMYHELSQNWLSN